MKQRFIPPPLISIEGYRYYKDSPSYSEYNYLKPGILSYIKRRHFEMALDLSSEYFHKCNVIDFGCNDGVFLPTLAHYFNNVLGIEVEETPLIFARRVISEMKLTNVDVMNNRGLMFRQIEDMISKEDYHVLYLLEVLEHIGRAPATMYEDKIEFLKEVSTLIDNDGVIVISVPNMVGTRFLVQRLGLEVFGQKHRDVVAFADLIRAGILFDTTNLEKCWVNGHVGFNHRKLEKFMRKSSAFLRRRPNSK